MANWLPTRICRSRLTLTLPVEERPIDRSDSSTGPPVPYTAGTTPNSSALAEVRPTSSQKTGPSSAISCVRGK